MENKEDTKEIIKDEHSIAGLYYNYKKTTDDEIRKFLSRVKIVKLTNKGYYPLSDEALNDILPNPRGKSLTFDATSIGTEPITGLRKYKEITFLVKSTSRFFLKPDVGEIIDQLSFTDFRSDSVKAILFQPSEVSGLDDTQGEHFIMKAILLVDENTKSSFTTNAGWVIIGKQYA
jgi:hypothetical protein